MNYLQFRLKDNEIGLDFLNKDHYYLLNANVVFSKIDIFDLDLKKICIGALYDLLVSMFPIFPRLFLWVTIVIGYSSQFNNYMGPNTLLNILGEGFSYTRMLTIKKIPLKYFLLS